jgi:hypothetical protein
VQEAVDIYGHLEKSRPDALQPDLATSLGALREALAAARVPLT